MGIYPMKKCLRFKKLVVFVVIFSVVSIGIKMRDLLGVKEDFGYPRMTVKKYELFQYSGEEFVVGSFLKNRSPGNATFCNFRLGDSESFNFTESDVSYSPELGEKGPYRVLYSVVKGFQFNSSETNSITYVTHITLKFLFHIVEVARRWEGPVSVACFLPGTDAILALKVLEKMCFCLREMENVNVHFVYPKHHPPEPMSLKNYSIWLDMEEEEQDEEGDDFDLSPWKMVTSETTVRNDSGTEDSKRTLKKKTSTCYVPQKILEDSYRKRKNLVYPINVARNVARYGSRSKFLLVSDIELLPSANLVTEFLKMVDRLKENDKIVRDHYFTKKKHVFVIPVFEIAKGVSDVPRTKSQLLDLYEKERAVYFHRYVCMHCQRFPGIQRWLQRKVHPKTKIGTIKPLLVVKREFPYHRWEPIYIGTNEEPLYSELLTWEGQQDKMTQMHEMCLLDYRFVILNGAFLVHTPGIKRRKRKVSGPPMKNNNFSTGGGNQINRNSEKSATESYSAWKNSHVKRNSHLYQIITQDVMGRYKFNPRCRIH